MSALAMIYEKKLYCFVLLLSFSFYLLLVLLSLNHLFCHPYVLMSTFLHRYSNLYSLYARVSLFVIYKFIDCTDLILHVSSTWSGEINVNTRLLFILTWATFLQMFQRLLTTLWQISRGELATYVNSKYICQRV
jgi:hypothetical protein